MVKDIKRRWPMYQCMLMGAGIALVLISIFLSGVGEPDPNWPKYWMLRPLIVVPIAGAMGTLVYYALHYVRQRGFWYRVVADFISLIAFVVALWLGTVLGLDGTLWN